MTKINNQSQNLNNIAGVEDLSHNHAATCSGGSVTFYDGRNRGFPSLTLLSGRKNLANESWANRASSIEISAGQTWRFWIDKDFQGNSITLGAGFHNLFGLFDNNIESFTRIS
ncbi:MAG: hypothetical protein C6Y22_12600 [Hapalosiphonaceae cyanobacterium JJU2]|nr:MAG: hypothetical protein C6Y22_12600 [Hapalosiphonaceae cyanobacterium JJU2]